MRRIKGVLPQFLLSLITFSILFLLPLAILLMNEWLVRDLLNLPVFDWIEQYDKRFVLNYILYVALFGTLFLFPRKIFYTLSFLLTAFLLLFGLGNRFKLELRSAPITLDDFRLLREVTGFESPVEINYWLVGTGTLVAILLLALVLYMLPSHKEKWLLKVAVVSAATVFFFAMWTDRPFSPAEQAGLQKTLWKLEVGMKNNGMLANFVVLAKESEVQPPEGYSQQAITTIDERYKLQEEQQNTKPNVLYIMSEAFIDPYYFGEEHFLVDPVPNFRKYFNESMHGTLYSSEFGGGTANVEFEALTGFSMQFMRPDYVPYQLFLHQPVPAIPSLFNDAGYESTAVHGYFAWFYQRNSVYKNLGFNQFISGEFMDLEKPNTPGGTFPSDRHMTDAILETLDASDRSDFIHAVSTQAHMPYGRQQESEFVKTDTLSDEVRPYLNNYVEKVHKVDLELGRLLSTLEEREEETLVVFWGDHLPSFPNGNELYGPLGTDIAEDWNGKHEDFLTMHSVPYFIWSSKDNQPQTRDISATFLPALVTELAGIEGNTVTALGSELLAEGHSRIPYTQWAAEEQPVSTTMQDLQLLQHDWLHGERYYESLHGELQVHQDFHLGLYEEILIQNQNKIETVYEWIVKGAPKYTEVLINGKPIDSFGWQRLEPGISKYTIPVEELKVGDTLQFMVTNARGSELMKSRTIEIEN